MNFITNAFSSRIVILDLASRPHESEKLSIYMSDSISPRWTRLRE